MIQSQRLGLIMIAGGIAAVVSGLWLEVTIPRVYAGLVLVPTGVVAVIRGISQFYSGELPTYSGPPPST